MGRRRVAPDAIRIEMSPLSPDPARLEVPSNRGSHAHRQESGFRVYGTRSDDQCEIERGRRAARGPCGFPRFLRPLHFPLPPRSAGRRNAPALSEGVRGYYIATGALERALAHIEWGPGHRNPDNTPRYFEPGMARLNFDFPSGSPRSN